MHISHEDLLELLNKATKHVEVGEIYTHYKNPSVEYRVVRLSITEVDDAVAVIYELVSNPQISFIRPLKSWLEYVLNDTYYVQKFSKK